MFLDLGIVLVVFRSDSRVVDDFLPSCYAMTSHGGIESVYCCIVCVAACKLVYSRCCCLMLLFTNLSGRERGEGEEMSSKVG